MRCHPVSNVPSGVSVTKCSSVQSQASRRFLTGDSSLISGIRSDDGRIRPGVRGPFVHQGEGLQSGRRFLLQGQAWLTINVLWYLASHWPLRIVCTDKAPGKDCLSFYTITVCMCVHVCASVCVLGDLQTNWGKKPRNTTKKHHACMLLILSLNPETLTRQE